MVLSYLVVSRRNLRNNMGFIFLKKRTCSEFRQPYKSYLKPQYYNCKRDLVTMGVYSRCKCVYLLQEEKGYHNVRIIQMYVKKNIVYKKENFEQNRQITHTMAIYFSWNALYLSLQRGNVSSLFSLSLTFLYFPIFFSWRKSQKSQNDINEFDSACVSTALNNTNLMHRKTYI